MTESEIRIHAVTAIHALGGAFVRLDGKIPLGSEKGFAERDRESLESAQGWAAQGNMGLRTGQISGGIVVVDIDAYKGVDLDGLDIPENTVSVLTPRGGEHRYFSTTETLKSGTGVIGKHIDFKADGGYVVMPGSVHPDTRGIYQWKNSPESFEILPLPEWIAARRRPRSTKELKVGRARGFTAIFANEYSAYVLTAVRRECDSVTVAGEGCRNDQLNRSAYSLGQLVGAGVLGENDAFDALMLAAPIDDTFSKKESVRTIGGGLTAGMSTPRRLPEPKKEEIPTILRTYAPEPTESDLCGFEVDSVPPPQIEDPGIVPYTVESLLARGITKIPYIMERIVPEKGICGLAGPGGGGKTWLALAIGSALSKGENFLRFTTNRSATVLLLDRESGPDRLCMRVGALGMTSGDPMVFLTRHELTGLYVSDKGFADHMLDILDRIAPRPEVLIFDSWARFYVESEIETREISKAFDRLAHVCLEGNVSIILIHHFNKGQSNDTRSMMDRVRGATDWVNACDTVWGLIHTPNGKLLEEVKPRDYEPLDPNPLGVHFGKQGERLAFWEGEVSSTKMSKFDSACIAIVRHLSSEPGISEKVDAIHLKYQAVCGQRTFRKAANVLIENGTVAKHSNGALELTNLGFCQIKDGGIK